MKTLKIQSRQVLNLIAFLLCSSLIMTAYADFNDAVKYLKQKEYTKAFNELQPLAEQDHVYAQLNLGRIYRDGLGVEKNAKEAFKWFEKAANQGSNDGLHHLGNSYASGKGAMKNKALAMQSYKKAADNGHAASMHSMGAMHSINKDYKKATEWFKRTYEREDLYKKFIGLWDSLKMAFWIDDYHDISFKYVTLSRESLNLIKE